MEDEKAADQPLRFLSSRIVYQNPWLRLREDLVRRGDAQEPYSVVERADSALVIPWSERENTVLLKQHRYPTQKHSWEFPGGAVASGETAGEAAARELCEETGIIADELEEIGVFHPVPALSHQSTTVFLARITDDRLRHSAKTMRVDDIIEMAIVPYGAVQEMVRTRTITDGLTLAGLALLESVRGLAASGGPAGLS
ncbi:NUDIX hydrolase [Actinocorallia longicatena]|uniref:Nudix hydrolase domain-containing protein n=1 Tax=Actinocorallia longicatena TaxID=111803 RepID=A0ABP6QB48_9ACTN